MINNKETRDELIKMLRDNSSLTLKEIGKLFGGLSESRVSRIAKEQASKREEPSPFASKAWGDVFLD